MIDGVQDALLAKKVDKSKIHFELFTAPGQALARNSQRARARTRPSGLSTVTVVLEGKSTELTMESDEDTILEAIRRVRPEVPYACESGVCATCRAKLLHGQVDTYLDFALEEHERKGGYILTCQSRPASEHIVLDFDAL
jgi:ring-1,2-phenylacetyl-CoA epoxidase subunit PaaE